MTTLLWNRRTRGARASGTALAALLLTVACGGDALPSGADLGAGEPAPAVLPPLDSAALTTDARLGPRRTQLAPPDSRRSYRPAELAAQLTDGFGDVIALAGEAHAARTPPGFMGAPPAPGPKARLLTRFVHLADAQLADDESPTRLVNADTTGATQSAFRPQEGHECRVLNAAVRTINKVHSGLPLSFVLLGGDNADSAQDNEVAWFMAILSGAPRVKCDSGRSDDPVPGPNNDGKDAFVAEGLKMPWYWVSGNHDVLIQGNFRVDDARIAEALGSQALGGTRDYSQPGSPIITDDIVADPGRRPLRRAELISKVAADGKGHGLSAAMAPGGRALYTFDVAGTPLRFLVLDTTAESGSAQGVLRQGEVTAQIRPLLDAALAAGKLVVLASHHSADSLSDGGEFGGIKQSDALLEPAWLAVLGAYPNVMMSMTGHSHESRVRYLPTQGSNGYWEVQTPALADLPQQMRLIEVWDQDNGWLSVRSTLLDYSTSGDAVAAEGRRLATLDYVSGWWTGNLATAADRNAELWWKKPL